MSKLLIVLIVGLLFEATGVVFLSKGLKQVGEVTAVNASEIVRIVKAGATNGHILLGVFLEAIFFGALLYLMSQADLSFVWPLTALGFVLTTLAAKIFLHEQISTARWLGVLLIMAGAALITWSEKSKPKTSTAANFASPVVELGAK